MPSDSPQSTAHIRGHPLHPMLVYFPIAFFCAALVTDLVSLGSTRPEWWAQASLYLIGAGLVTAVFTAAAGAIDFLGSRRIRDHATARWHAGINVLVVLLEVVNWSLRDGTVVTGTQVTLSAVCVLLLGVSGWLGGEMVFRHGFGVSPRETVR